MAFLPSIPQPTDQLSVSQANILNNFGILGAIAGNTNPASSSINSTAGFNFLYLPAQAGSPPAGASFPAGEIGLYSFVNAATSQKELYVNKTNQATVVQIPMTASILSINSAPGAGSSWSYLPSGLLYKSGNSTGALSGLTLVTINSGGINGPAFTQLLNVIVCPFNGSSTGDLDFAVRLVDIVAANQFRIYISKRTSTGAASGQTGFQFFAIGY